MLLEELPYQTEIFVDANIFLYDILEVKKWFSSCNKFLKLIENGELRAFSSPIVIGEVLHKLMISEVVKKHKVKPNRAVTFLMDNPENVRKLKKYTEIIKKVETLPITIPDISRSTILIANRFTEDYGFLINDALHLAVMRDKNLINLASNDSDFERVDWINLYKPSKE